MIKKDGLPVIYEYNDFRRYIEDYQQARQRLEKNFTKSEFSRRMQLPNTRSYVLDVLNGKKVSATFIERFVIAMELDLKEAQYFRALVKFNQAQRADERELYFNQLIALNNTPVKILNKNMFKYYTNSYNSIIRAILNVIEFKDEYAMLARKVIPAITVAQARESVKLLVDLGLIAPDDKGFLRPTQKTISAPDRVKDELIRQYQLSCLDRARDAVVKPDCSHQIIATNTISISEKGYQRLRSRIDSFRSEMRAIVDKDEDPADKIYQFTVTFIPVVKQENK